MARINSIAVKSIWLEDSLGASSVFGMSDDGFIGEYEDFVSEFV